MRIRTVVVSALVIVAVGTFVFLDADPDGREELWNRVTTAFGAEAEPEAVPNWGDVAERIGQFTDEERNLREVLAPAVAGDVPTPETPPPVAAPTEGTAPAGEAAPAEGTPGANGPGAAAEPTAPKP